MSTVRITGSRDPPQTTTNVVGFKRIREKVSLTLGVGALTVGTLRSCLPLSNPEIRILKISAWAPDDVPGSLSMVFPIGNTANSDRGDNSVWVDEGTTGQQRAQIHLQPCFEYRNYWQPVGLANATPIATFGYPQGVLPVTVIVDVTVQYRTAIQSCPALEYLQELQELETCAELFH